MADQEKKEKGGFTRRKAIKIAVAGVLGVAGAAIGSGAGVELSGLIRPFSLPPEERAKALESLGFRLIPVEVVNWEQEVFAGREKVRPPTLAAIEKNGFLVGYALSFRSDMVLGADEVKLIINGETGPIASPEIERDYFRMSTPPKDPEKELFSVSVLGPGSGLESSNEQPLPTFLGRNLFWCDTPLYKAKEIGLFCSSEGKFVLDKDGYLHYEGKPVRSCRAKLPEVPLQKRPGIGSFSA